MPKELYLYQGIWAYTAENLISQLEANSHEDITLRLNSPGGSVLAGWGIVAKMAEKKHGKITIKVDGAAMSMAALMLLFADRVEATDVSSIMIHRADGPVSSPDDQKYLDQKNSELRGKMEKRINSVKLKELKGFTVADMFENPIRQDIYLTAQQAKDVGLVDEIFTLTPKEINANNSAFEKYFGIAAEQNHNHQNPNPMTLEKIKAEHPELYKQIVAIGASVEKDRVQAWAHFAQVDPEAVKKGIAEGATLTQVQMIEFMEKKSNVKALGDLKDETGDNKIKTAAEKDTEIKAEAAKKAESEEFWNNVSAMTGVKL